MHDVQTDTTRADWETPSELIADLATVFPWDLDACAARPNVCANYYTIDDDGLSKPWAPLTWCNMPYGKKQHVDWWMQKARLEGQRPGITAVCLPPARTATTWWHNNVPFADLVVFHRRRLRFRLPGGGMPKNGAGFPSAFVVFGELTQPQRQKLCSYGWPVFPRLLMPVHMCPGACDLLVKNREN